MKLSRGEEEVCTLQEGGTGSRVYEDFEFSMMLWSRPITRAEPHSHSLLFMAQNSK